VFILKELKVIFFPHTFASVDSKGPYIEQEIVQRALRFASVANKRRQPVGWRQKAKTPAGMLALRDTRRNLSSTYTTRVVTGCQGKKAEVG
jgi:hypothetical protein